ncbi:LysR family transcriptional regulator [uncultured Kiloniella sp.]|uniref:LysR family transcriptional regulator n=1 Tax=uncultured Kiloniella sp. TaxID=1133091 RepID=UPI00261634B5|nr:LysR family transcriptional regulator [uncultured Kiloniella sp.]
MNEQGEYWRDLRTVLAVAKAGSLSGAARLLGISHATVFRHINHIEEKLEAKLFERNRDGYVLTAAGEAITHRVEQFDHDLVALERQILGEELQPRGLVRITTTDTLLINFLSPVFADLQRAYPDIELEIGCSNELVNLNKREAEIAIRPSKKSPDNMVGRKMADIRVGIYGRVQDHEYLLDGNREIESLDGLRDLNWIGPDESLAHLRIYKWLQRNGLYGQVKTRYNSLLAVADAVRHGGGVAILPCFMAAIDPSLLALKTPLDGFDNELWLLTHPDLRKVGRIRACMDFLSSAIDQKKHLLAGEF